MQATRSIILRSRQILMVLTVIFIFSKISANPASKIEFFLLNPGEQTLASLQLGTKDLYSPEAKWAIGQALLQESKGNDQGRDKFLSLGLFYLEAATFENFKRQRSQARKRNPQAPGLEADAAKDQKKIFKRLYEGQGLMDPKLQKTVGDAAQAQVDFEGWFLGFLNKLGLLEKNYKEQNDKLRAKYPHLTEAELADILIDRSARLTAGVGFVASLPGIFPGAGTATQLVVNVSTMIPDMIYLFKHQATLVYRIAELYGKDLKDEDRQTEALILFGIASGVSAAARALEQSLENKIGIYIRAKVTTESVRQGIARVGTLHPLVKDILTTLFQRKAITEATVEKSLVGLVPLVGAGVSGAMNYMFTQKVGDVAKEFYSDTGAKTLEAINNLNLARVELAMFRALILVMNADGLQKPIEKMALQKVLSRFPHNRKLVERMVEGELDLIEKVDYDLSKESDIVKEHILYSLASMEYVDGEKGPEEIDLHSQIIRKFVISKKMDEKVEIRVRKEKDVGSNFLKSIIDRGYWFYQKAIGAKTPMDF
jgi:uncharacterized protein (DUF697 family)